MPIAHLIAAHAHPDLLARRIGQALADEDSGVFVHVDVKSDGLVDRIPAHPRVRVLDCRLDICWGGISQVHATLALLQAALADDTRYTHFVYGSGQDLLVRSGLHQRLSEAVDRSFLTWSEDRPAPRNGFTNMLWPDVFKRNDRGLHPRRMLRSLLIRAGHAGLPLVRNRRPLPAGYRLYRGSAWFTLHRRAAEYLCGPDGHREALLQFFEHALMPEERFFQTALVNSPLADSLINDNLLFTRFVGNSPRDLTMADVAVIRESGAYIARKFNPRTDAEVIDYYAPSEDRKPL